MGAEDAAVRVAESLPEELQPNSRGGRVLAGVGTLILALLLLLSLGTVIWDYLQPGGPVWLLDQVKSRPYLSGPGLLAIEEAGLPLPLPGDIAVMFAAHRAPRSPAVLAGVWLLLMVATVLGSAILFGVGRRWGRQLAEGRVGEALHLNSERLQKAEGWFERRGLWVVLIGRYIPGGRVPITVAAATFGVPFKTFLAAVAASAAVWLVAFMALGLALGPKVDEIVRAHRTSSLIVPAGVALLFFGYLGFRLLRTRRAGSERPGEPTT